MFKRSAYVLAIAMCAEFAFSLPAAADGSAIGGHWQGAMISQNAGVSISFDFVSNSAGAEGKFTSRSQLVMDYPLDSVSVKGKAVEFVLGGGFRFDGSVTAETIKGSFTSSGLKGRFELHRAPAEALPYKTEDVVFRNGDVVLHGTLCVPRARGRHPAVVLLHGSGPQSRWGTQRAIADHFARKGIAALVYDKRGSGISTGDWRTASYQDLAKDALAGVAFLAQRSDIDPVRIGLLGHSEGGTVAAVAAALAPHEIGFVIAEDTVAGLPMDQDIYRVQNAIADEDFSPQEKAKAMEIYRLFVDVARQARPYADLEAASRPYTETKWYKWLSIPQRGEWVWSWYPKVADFDTLTVWRKVRVPVLIVYGEKDAIAPVDESIAKIEATLDLSGAPYTSIIIPGAQHNLTVQPGPHDKFFWWHTAPGIPDILIAWTKMTTAKQGSERND